MKKFDKLVRDRIPEIIKADAYSPFVYAIRYLERPYEISFEIIKHENFEMDPAIADRIQYTFVISPHGKLLAQVHMWIRNSQKQFASFILPPGTKALCIFLVIFTFQNHPEIFSKHPWQALFHGGTIKRNI